MTDQITNHNPNSKYLVTIIILVAFLLIGNLFLLFTTYQQNSLAEQRAANYADRVKTAQDLIGSQKEMILNLITDYEKVAYDNPELDRISEQQLIATEFQLQALQLIAIQNSQVIELLANAP